MTRQYSNRMHTAHFSGQNGMSDPGGVPSRVGCTFQNGVHRPGSVRGIFIPLKATWGQAYPPPGKDMGPGISPQKGHGTRHTPKEAWYQAYHPRSMGPGIASHPSPSPRGQIDTSENITLPKPSLRAIKIKLDSCALST